MEVRFINSLKNLGLWLGIPALLAVSFSCLPEGNEGPSFEELALVSIYHASPDSPSLDVFTEIRRVSSNPLTFGRSYPYLPFNPGDRLLKFTPANSVNFLLESEIELDRNKIYSVFLINEQNDLDLLLIEDQWEAPSSGKSSLRLIHLSPDGGDFKISIKNSENQLLEALSYTEYTQFKELESGKYDIQVLDMETETVLVEAKDIELRQGRVNSILLRGFTSRGDNANRLSIQLLTNTVFN